MTYVSAIISSIIFSLVSVMMGMLAIGVTVYGISIDGMSMPAHVNFAAVVFFVFMSVILHDCAVSVIDNCFAEDEKELDTEH